jgi:hypothetical protein
MNPYGKPDILKFDPSKYSTAKKTPQMSRLEPQMSKVTDTAASAKARFQATQPKTTSTPKPTTSTTPKVSEDKSQAPKKVEKTSQQKYEDDVKRQIENAYKSQIDFLTGQEQRLQSQLPDYLASISRPFEAQQPLLQQQLQEQQARGMTEQEGIRMQEQQALAGARRTAEEAGIRAVQQFGGVGGSSAAQAAGELIGREQLRQQGNIQQQRVQGIQNINDQLRAIQGEFNAQVANLNLQKEQALSQARLNFQQQLDTIRKERMTAGVTKAQMTIDALGQFAARRQQIEDQVTQQSNNLNLLREQATLNAQNLKLQQSITPQAVTQLPFSTQEFFGQGSNQSNELSKVLQAGVTSGTLQPFGTSATGESLFVDKDGKIVDIRGNQYQ